MSGSAPIELDGSNILEYLNTHVVPHVAAEPAAIADVREVTDQTYVNWIFAAVLEVDGHRKTIYVRQTRDRVKSKPDMAMDPGRIAFEIKILQRLEQLVPGMTPEVLYHDSENNVAVLTDVRRGAPLLVDELRGGRSHPETGDYFGRQIGRVHRETTGIEHEAVRGSAEENDRAVAFHLGMRLEPALDKYPELTNGLLAASRQAPACLVLGDLASKNIFVEGREVRFLDLERAFVGDPAFDLAFLFCHYLIEVPTLALETSVSFIENFMVAYRAELGQSLNPDGLAQLENRLLRFLGVTILYRIFGFYLVVDVGEDKSKWDCRAANLLQDTETTDLVRGLKGALEVD